MVELRIFKLRDHLMWDARREEYADGSKAAFLLLGRIGFKVAWRG